MSEFAGNSLPHAITCRWCQAYAMLDDDEYCSTYCREMAINEVQGENYGD